MRNLSVFLFVCLFNSSSWICSQTLIGNYYDSDNQTWHLVDINPSSGQVKEIGNVTGLLALGNPYSSFAVDGIKNKVHFFGFDNDNLFRFYTLSLEDAEVLSSPIVDEDGWYGLTFNSNDSLLYVSKGVYDGLGTNLIRFVNHENGSYEHVQHIELESSGPSAISNDNIFVTLASEYTTGIPDGNYYSVSYDIVDSTQSFVVLCDFMSPEFLADIRYYASNDTFYAIKKDYDNNNIDFVSFNPASGQTQLIADLSGFERTNIGGGILHALGHYIFIGNYAGDTVQRVFSIDIQTGEVVNNPALSLQVQIRGIDVDQNSLVGIDETPLLQNNISVYPNPASDVIHFEMNAQVEYSVVDVLGKVLFSSIASQDNETVVDVSGLAVGVYHLRAGNNRAGSFVITR